MLYKVALDPIMLYKMDNHSLNLCKFASDLLQNIEKIHNQLLLQMHYCLSFKFKMQYLLNNHASKSLLFKFQMRYLLQISV
jgi:hypothetical protein